MPSFCLGSSKGSLNPLMEECPQPLAFRSVETRALFLRSIPFPVQLQARAGQCPLINLCRLLEFAVKPNGEWAEGKGHRRARCWGKGSGWPQTPAAGEAQVSGAHPAAVRGEPRPCPQLAVAQGALASAKTEFHSQAAPVGQKCPQCSGHRTSGGSRAPSPGHSRRQRAGAPVGDLQPGPGGQFGFICVC